MFQLLTADDNNLLAVKELFGNNAGQPAEQVALAINYHLIRAIVRFILRLGKMHVAEARCRDSWWSPKCCTWPEGRRARARRGDSPIL